MSKVHQEERPLLHEEEPLEEDHLPRQGHYFNLRRIHVRAGRSRNKAKGAAHIISRWPDHWSSSATFLWSIIIMMFVIILILYNSSFSMSLRPMKLANQQLLKRNFDNSRPTTYVHMHIIVNNFNETGYFQYLPVLKSLMMKHAQFHYNFVLFYNDTHQPISPGSISDAENIQGALKIILSEKEVNRKDSRINLSIECTSLVKYLDTSPISSKWRLLPVQMIPFLVRSISIWDRAGIVFNPDILKPNEMTDQYRVKLELIMKRYSKTLEQNFTHYKNKKIVFRKKATVKKRLNNIQEIIIALQNENSTEGNVLQANLTEDENRNIEVLSTISNKFGNKYIVSNVDQKSSGNSDDVNKMKYSSADSNIFKRFMEILNGGATDASPKNPSFQNELRTATDYVIVQPASKDFISYNRKTTLLETTLQPKITVDKGYYQKSKSNKFLPSNSGDGNNSKNHLTIDLAGNIIATDTPCHAFIGTLFNHCVNYTNKYNVTEFVMQELSLFCNGLITNCNGIDIV